MYEINYCPKCGTPMEHKSWYEEGRLVEWNDSCNCGYVSGWSYGSYYEENAEEENAEEEEEEEEGFK